MRLVENVLIVLSIACLFFLVGWVSGCSGTRQTPKLVQATEFDAMRYEAIVKLYNRETGRFFCSGTVIGANYILTADHCVDKMKKNRPTIEVRAIGEKTITAVGYVSSFEGHSDVALVYGNFSKFNSLSFENEPSADINAIYTHRLVTCGFAYGGDLLCTPFTARWPSFFSVGGQGMMFPGMSGGPVLDLDTGKVVGTNYAMGDNVALITPLVEPLFN